MSIIESLITLVTQKSVITLKEQISSHAFHLRLQSESIKNVDFEPGNFIRVLAGYGKNKSMDDMLRTYSVWQFDKNKGTIDLAIAKHSNGPGAEWIRDCKPGDTVYFTWKKGNFVINSFADDYIFIGDLSALGHLYQINRELPAGKNIYSIIYAPDDSQFFEDINGTNPFDFYKTQENPVNFIIQKLSEITKKVSKNTLVYIGGDSRVCIAVRNHFRKELKWENNKIKTKPFWNPAKKGLD